MLKITGIALIIIGVIMMAYTGFNFVTTKKIVDLGPIKINKEIDHPVEWSPIIGAMLLLGGIVIVAGNKVSNKK